MSPITLVAGAVVAGEIDVRMAGHLQRDACGAVALEAALAAPANRAASWLLGGLNFQIEHHLFSRICHVNYPTIAPVVEQTCREFGVEYKHNRTLLSAVRSLRPAAVRVHTVS